MYGKIQKLRFAAMATSMTVAALTFFVGAVWIKSLYNGIDRARLEDTGREIRSRLMVLRQMAQADLVAFELPKYSLAAQSQRQASVDFTQHIPENFDLVAFYQTSRKLTGGARREGKDRTAVAAGDASLAGLLPKEAAFFDIAATEGQASGIMIHEGKPLIVGLKTLRRHDDVIGFVLGGRRIDPRKLAPTASLAEKAFEIHVPMPRVSFPTDVEQARELLVGDTRDYVRLDRRSEGVGYLRFDDIFERTAFILKFPWVDTSVSGERRALAWLFVCAMVFGGLIHLTTSGALTWFVRQRRHNPGLGGLSDRDLRLTVESFPGYAFALDQAGSYIAVSRSLAGLLGKEPSDCHGKPFGQVAAESGFSAEEVFSHLKGSQHWPSVVDIEMRFRGLGEARELHGTAYIISQRQIVLYFLRHPPKSAAASKAAA